MAGKTKREGGQAPQTPKAAEPSKPLGHLGVKSSPFAPTDCKLVSQYMVRDRMTAHYKKLNKAKAAVDTAPPKAWLVSQKMRDQARREAKKADEKKDKFPQTNRPYSAQGRRFSESDIDGEEFMMNSNLYRDDQPRSARYANTSMEIHQSDSGIDPFVKHTASDMRLINSIIDDSVQSPSKYSSYKTYKSNIPLSPTHTSKKMVGTHKKMKPQQALYKTQVLAPYSPVMYDNTVMIYANPILTPRSADLIDLHKEKFTEEKDFQPRTLKTNRESKLSQFKYYTPPKRKQKEADHSPVRPESAMSTKTPLRSSMRPGTANTMESTDWMNDTLMSRDDTDHSSPSGVPRLDISLDKDHMNWLQDQSFKAKVRSTSGRTRKSEDRVSTRGRDDLMETNGHGATFTLNGSLRTMGSPGSKTARDIEEEEEELQYLEFVKDVTNDILDRGIFTNRVLKQVFETHVIRRRHQLREEKMREMLEDLRIDLGIPGSDDDDPNGLGLTSTWNSSNSRKNRRSRQHDGAATATMAGSSTTTGKKSLPNLHARTTQPTRGRTPSPEGKPPLPKAGSSRTGGGSRSYLDSTASSLEASQEYGTTKDGDSVFGTVTNVGSSSAKEGETANQLSETLNGEDTMNGNSTVNSTMLYQQQLQASLDRDDSERDSEVFSDKSPLMTQRSETEDQYTARTEEGQYTERSEEGRYTGRTYDGQSTGRSQQSSYRSQEDGGKSPRVQDSYRSSDNGDRTDQGDASVTGEEYTTVTEEDEDLFTERTLTDTARSTHRQMDDSEKEITPRRRKKSPKSPKTPKYASSGKAEPVDSARSHDRGNTTEDTIEVSDIEDY